MTQVNGGGRLDTGGIARRIRDIALRAARKGEPLPSELALAQRFGISRPALREILVTLEAEGLIRRRQGAPTIVNPAAGDVPVRFDRGGDYGEAIRRVGRKPTLEVLEASSSKLSDGDADTLRLPAGVVAYRTVKRWSADGVPAVVTVDIVPVRDGRGSRSVLAALDPAASLAELINVLHGDIVEWELAWPGAQLASAAVGAWLGMPRRSAVLTLEVVSVARGGARCACGVQYFAPGQLRTGLIRPVISAPRGRGRRVP